MLNRYHPLVFYVSVGLLIVVFLEYVKAYVGNNRALFSILTLQSSHSIIWSLISINLVALWMGSWWALQEGTWGGWWNWDSSEMFGLLISFAGLSLQHTLWYLRSKTSFVLKLALFILYILISYSFIQLNFDLVSHNFGAKFFSIFNDNLFFVEALFVLTLANLVLFRELQFWNNLVTPFKHGLKKESFITTFYKLLTPLIAIAWVCWSYKPLMNYFLWNFAELNALNSETSLQPINFFATIILLLWLTLWTRSSLSAMTFVTALTPHWMFAIILSHNSYSLHNILHFTLLMTSLFNLVLYDVSFTYWAPLTPYELFYVHPYAQCALAKEWILDTNLFDSLGLWLSTDGSYSMMWNVFINTNSPSINFFSLTFSHSTFNNLYILGELYSSPTLILELPSVLALNSLFIIVILTKQLSVRLTKSPTII